uniref:hypothetical protein n=1 Tax=Ningiella ruwaisensis TaxID=2364274 RepID=UPI0010A08058|nr:hypothetical protein [Ningiella ruwaisensis]
MWRWIVAIVSVICLALLLTTDTSKTFFAGVGGTINGWYDSLANVPERRQLTRLQTRFLHNNMSLKPHQTDYVYEVTSSLQSVRTFYDLYCVKGDKNPYLFGNNLMKFCSDIAQEQIISANK